MGTETQAQMPEKIGRFQLTGTLGQGAMSVVHKAFDPEINRTIAIKLLRGERAADPEYRFRFLQEAKAAGKLTHPNIVTIYDVGESPEGPYIAMELLEGRTLREVMTSGRPLPLREKIEYGIQLAEALSYSHANQVVHRDIKPGNIVLSKDEKRVLITDFGIAHIESASKSEQTHAGAIVGTPQYMSPEQVEGATVDGRSDLYSLGVVLYQLFTGETAFEAETLTTLLLQIGQNEPRPIREKIPGLPESLEKVVAKLLRKSPGQRFQDGTEVADALRQVLRETEERENHRDAVGILPLRIKWTLVMAVVVAVAMVLGSWFVYRTQVRAMTQLTLDSGSSLAEFIAVESAEAVLIRDWIAVETFVKEARERQQISYLMIRDHQGRLRGSTETEALDDTGPSRLTAPSKVGVGEVVYAEAVHAGEKVFDFEVPILYQQKKIGSLQLGLSQTALIAAAELTQYTMLGLLAALVATVVVFAYLLAAGITLPMKLLRQAMAQVTEGNYNYRIEETRNDELGQLFGVYNEMIDALSAKSEADALPAAEKVDERQARPDEGESVENASGDSLSDTDLFLLKLQRKQLVADEVGGSTPLCDEPTLVIRPESRE